MYYDNAEGMVFRPPSEANSFILRATIGCSHNACTFCSMYRGVRFRVRPFEELEQILQEASQHWPDTRRVFIGDGNSLVLPTDQLLHIIGMLRRAFPKLSRVTCYGGPRDILKKAPEELAALKQAGLQIIYLGIESGDDDVLRAIGKGVTSSDMIAAGRKVMESGIKLSAMVILGLGGKERSREHALNTAAAVSAISPTMLSALTLMLHKGTPLRQAADRGDFTPLSPYELVQELKLLIEHCDMTSPCIFRSNHVSNLLPLAGTLPQDKTELLGDIEEMLAICRNRTTPSYNDTGEF